MSSDRVSFEFSPPPRGTPIPRWMWEGPATADVSLAVLRKIFEPDVDIGTPQLIQRYWPALVTAARRRAVALGRRPSKPIRLGRRDLEDLTALVHWPTP